MMTSLKRIPTGKGYKKNPLEQEREQFERAQESSFRKAISDDEVPIKMKHVRTLIIGTHTDKNGSVFWRLVALTPPIHTDITAWKFCHTIHLLLRDGHPKFIPNAIENISRIQNLGEHFRHLPVGYGLLIKCYCELLVCKLNFHDHFPNSAGNMQMTPEQLNAITGNDANSYFQMAVEILDYMEKILNLYEAVFHSMNPSRSNSMTKTGQCRMAPLIPCIQDSSCLYDLIVRILFQLHKVHGRFNPFIYGTVPTDMLSGHRKRFHGQFKLLQQFYDGTRNLQYFKLLVQVPFLPQVAPNFLVEAELRSHVAPVVVLEEEQLDVADSVLVDTSESGPPPIPPHPHPDVVNSQNSSMVEVMAEKESLIDALQHQLRLLGGEIQKERSESSHVQQQLRLRVNDLESSIGELDSELVAERQSKASILTQVEAATASAEVMTKLAEEDTRRRAAEEKFSKMKDVYQKLREEHIALIRSKSDMDKVVMSEKEKAQQEFEKREELDRARKQLEAQLSDKHQSFSQTQKDKEQIEQSMASVVKEKEELFCQKEALELAVTQLEQQTDQQAEDTSAQLLDARRSMYKLMASCLHSSANSGQQLIKHSLDQFDCGAHSVIKSTPEYTLMLQAPIESLLGGLSETHWVYFGEPEQASHVIAAVSLLCSHMSSFLVYAKATSHASPNIEVADGLVACLETLGQRTLQLLENIKQETTIDDSLLLLQTEFTRSCDLVSRCEDISPSQEDLVVTVQREMEAMDSAIQEAVDKFTTLLTQSRAKDSGMQLEVNENILGTCGDLMAAVRLLVERSSALQKEIVAAGKAGASPTEFYKRNHRWTEGLISGAKAVALACQALVSSADQVANNQGKFEEVIVASREIAASSMQLVMASRVKAERTSHKLANVNSAAKSISTLTGTVVATAESCREKLNDATQLDFSNLSLHATKRLEMDTQVKMLEAEKKLVDERAKLAQLRRHHYKLAGETQPNSDQQESQ